MIKIPNQLLEKFDEMIHLLKKIKYYTRCIYDHLDYPKPTFSAKSREVKERYHPPINEEYDEK